MKPARSLLIPLALGVSIALVGLESVQSGQETAPAGDAADPGVLQTRTGPVALRPPPDEAVQGESARPIYAQDRVMVRVDASTDLEALARDHRSRVLRASPRAGYASLAVPAETSPRSFLATLRSDERVAGASAMGLIRGAGSYDDQTKRASRHQWHHVAARSPLPEEYDLSDYVVAVLDTGVAYETHADASGQYVVAPSLAGVAVVAPYDFVNDDAHANDDHQHGTHIASLIASEGSVEGVAAGVSLMPLKVLDENNAGNELALVEAVYHAIDNGADVINMSLSFMPGYVPSVALREALAAAAEAGIVLVGASGNDAAGIVSWPAASKVVIAVGGSRPGPWDDTQGNGWDKKETYLADYSNRGTMLDVCAPGGALDFDRTDDDVLDGIVAETILPGDPASTGLWVYAGTSQAAAQVSGAAVHLLAAGADAEQVRLALMYEAFHEGYQANPWADGSGAGGMNLEKALSAVVDGKSEISSARTWHAGVVPYLRKKSVVSDGKKKKKSGDADYLEIQPRARVTVVDNTGAPFEDGWVYGTLWSTAGRTTVMCELTDSSGGTCELTGDKYLISDPATPGAFAFTVDGVHDGHVMHRLGRAAFATDGGEILLSALGNTPELDGSILAFHYEDGVEDTELDKLAESYSIVDMGTGLASSPLGIVFQPSAIVSESTVTEVDVDLDGTGLASSPLGMTTVKLLTFDGTGLASSPLGFTTLRFAAVDGTGLASSPLGFHVTHMFGISSGTGLASSPLGLSGEPMLLGPGVSLGADLTGLALGDMLTGQGTRTGDGEDAAALLAASGAVDLAMTPDELAGTATTDGSLSLEDAGL
jgi:hypothetical protein